ncbi:amidohydrolase family protein [Chelativorans sp. J32]|uniref:amidohydrolase family protein n=1 Tax=Chelativorans sp. J32 TaxID=935840 RepID=UPI0004875709|nr:amidohydrolase family protein [Chelativorans sp. J32]
MRIFDCRLRPPFGEFLTTSYFTDVPRITRMAAEMGLEAPASLAEASMELLFTEMDAAGVGMGLAAGRISPGLGNVSNASVRELCRLWPDRFVGLAVVDPGKAAEASAEIDRAMRDGFKGALIEPGLLGNALAIDDRRIYPFYSHCEDAGIPLFIMAGGNAGPDLSFTNPEHLDRVAADFPRLKLVSLHGSWPWVLQILHVCLRRQNVYLCPDMYLAGRMPGFEEYVRAANGFLSDRLLFGSSYPVLALDRAVKSVQQIGFRPEVLERIFFRNAAALLGL